MTTPLVRSADAHLQSALALVDSSFSLDRGMPEGAVNRELLGFHLEAARREIRHLTDRPAPGRTADPDAPVEGVGEQSPEASPGLGAGADLHDPEQPRPKPKPGAARHMPGTAALARAINESLARRA